MRLDIMTAVALAVQAFLGLGVNSGTIRQAMRRRSRENVLSKSPIHVSTRGIHTVGIAPEPDSAWMVQMSRSSRMQAMAF
jgi:hypothetical protein